ncbi:MAG: hypothetical protein Q4A84_00015 [Neisseria sp.]|uniref:hypothetical protein n=1 Tax=Neisseria sp. TaxID=192066 RepID=UPI0026DD0FEF|nr:hypothetical protein [Neisseria sp.]MDO4640080.1 hypothetical protein [Neisseria sp.]
MALTPEMDYLMNSISCVLCNGAQHTNIQIVEHDKSAKLKKVNIEAVNGDWFCFSPDEGRKCKHIHKSAKNIVVMSPLLKIDAQFNHHCACDAVLLIRQDGKLVVIYMDLKSGNSEGYSPQFQSTRQFVRYLISLYEEFNGTKLPIDEERYVIFHTGNLNKTTTIPKQRISQSKPNAAYKRSVKNGDTLYLKELLT